MMVEAPQRMLMKRPTVARTSETGVWPVASSPTRAREPRTEITRPKDVTVFEPGCLEMGLAQYGQFQLAKRLSRRDSASAKSAPSGSGFVLQQRFVRCLGHELRRKIRAFLNLR